VPTFDRHATLPITVRSIQNQTVRDIEILIAGDGCTPETREAALAIVSADSRVRFLDLPKAPIRGAANRDRAVREASAARIFYSDDDDLLLPHHVEVLGPALDHADVADTPAATMMIHGPVALGILNSGHPVQRDLLKSGRLKSVFDTHLAHRKKTYLDRAGAWLAAPDRRVVLHMLKSFASDDAVKWKTLQRTTACSFHGARRINATPAERGRELEDFSRGLSPDREHALRAGGGYCGYALLLLSALDDAQIADAASLFRAVGLELEPLSMSTRQVSSVDATMAAAQGRQPAMEAASHAIAELLEPLHAPVFPVRGSLAPFVAALGDRVVAEILDQLPDRLPVLAARAWIKLRAGDPSAAVSVLRALDQLPEADRFGAGMELAEELEARGHSDPAWDWTARTIPTVKLSYRTVAFWRFREALARKRGATADEAHANAQVLAGKKMEN
jgi:hypothetical protein